MPTADRVLPWRRSAHAVPHDARELVDTYRRKHPKADTTLLTRAYRPEETNRAQGVMDTAVFCTMALSSFSSGALITTQGWTWLNLGSLMPMGVVLLALGWLALQQRRAAAVQPAG